jgi:catechol 2,3-dioxygenase-like lactoylglutathione lyase family enzyme
VITAVHTLVYSEDAEATRAFFRDVLGYPNVDAHEGWLIFGTGPSELGVHPADATAGPPVARHEITLMCDDIGKTVAELTAKGVEFDGGISDAGFGRTATFAVPGAGSMMLYEPRHPVAYEL